MDDREVIRSQYQASLEMLRQAIARCPDALWDNPGDKNKFWNIAYHTLFYTHLYLQESAQAFRPWAKHRKDYENFVIGMREPFTTQDVLAYLEVCRQQVDEKTSQLKLDAESGFGWVPCNKLELQFYNIRHIQQHTGELMERLGTRAGIDVDWVSLKHD